MQNVSLKYVSTDATADAASCSTIAAFILIPEESKPKSIIVQVVPKQYQFKKYKNCFVLMRLHLMLKIFVCDAWLAVWIFFEKFCSKIFGTLQG